MAGRANHRERLVEGALHCLQTKGYAATTARDIAAAAEANLGSIGYHFTSTDALLLEALGVGFERWTSEVATRLLRQPHAAPLEQLEHGWAEMLTSFDAHRGLLTAFVEALPAASRSPELRHQLAEQYQQSRDAFAALIRSALGADAGSRDVDALAALLVAVADGLVVQWLIDGDRVPSAQALADGVRAALQAYSHASRSV